MHRRPTAPGQKQTLARGFWRTALSPRFRHAAPGRQGCCFRDRTRASKALSPNPKLPPFLPLSKAASLWREGEITSGQRMSQALGKGALPGGPERGHLRPWRAEGLLLGQLHATCGPVSVPADGTPSPERALGRRPGAAKNPLWTRPVLGRTRLRLTGCVLCKSPSCVLAGLRVPLPCRK